MGISIYKTEYICDCGEDWGSCGKKSGFIMSYNRSCDLGTITHFHGDTTEDMGTFTDAGLSALNKLLLLEDPTSLTEEDKEFMKKHKIFGAY